MALAPYVVVQGDYLTRLGYLRGFAPADVWDHPSNADLKALRKNMDILLPGDVLYIPEDPSPPSSLAVGSGNRFMARVPTVTVALTLRAEDKPLAGEPYELRGLGDPVSGNLDGDGKISIDVPVNVGELHIFLPQRNELYPVRVGFLDPATERSGAWGRLSNLGYFGYLGAESVTDDAYRRALMAFQKDHADDCGLTATGELDADTSRALVTVHGS
jgi:hypothetical protein